MPLTAKPNDPITYEMYLVARLLQHGVSWPSAIESVINTSFEHPEWDDEPKRTWDEWQGLHSVTSA
jgi:hypothetical protein